MKNLIAVCTITMLFLAFTANANNNPKNGPDKPVAVQQANFKEGQVKLTDYIKSKLEHPAYARSYALEGQVTISFFILPNGSVHGARVVEGLEKHCNEAVLEVIKNMPKWTPASRNGQAIGSKHKVTVNFELEI